MGTLSRCHRYRWQARKTQKNYFLIVQVSRAFINVIRMLVEVRIKILSQSITLVTAYTANLTLARNLH